MPRISFSKLLSSLLVVGALALPAAAPIGVSATPAPGRLDDEIAQRIQVTPANERIPVIVEGAPDGFAQGDNIRRAQRAEDRVRTIGAGTHVKGNSNLLGATVAELTPAEIRALSADAGVDRIHFDTAVHASATNQDNTAPGQTPIVFEQTVGAPQAWQQGITGTDVAVAVLDTGIDDNNAAFGARVKARVDLVDPTHPAQGDPAGHGTHVAGIVAASRAFVAPGIAPEANLVSVRVLDQTGASRLSTVMLGLEWVVAHKTQLGIRVVVMALGAPAVTGYREDPLAAASELAWHSGLVVVTAAGNGGPAAGTIETPGIDPLVLTVGASDDNGTPRTSDDVLPAWSSVGPTPDRLAKPDLVAPGRKIVSVRVPGSTIDQLSPDHIEGPTTIRFSGTSEAAAVAAGAAALLIQQRPDLQPDQTKSLLTSTARKLDNVRDAAQGNGQLNVARALQAATPRVTPSPLPPANALLRVVWIQLLRDGAIDWDQVRWDQVRWDQVRWDQVRWDQVRWDQVRWDQVRWDQVRWDQVRWDQVRWDQVRWDQVRWDQVRWDQVRWDQVRWDQVRWD
jgi:serine protease AprX